MSPTLSSVVPSGEDDSGTLWRAGTTRRYDRSPPLEGNAHPTPFPVPRSDFKKSEVPSSTREPPLMPKKGHLHLDAARKPSKLSPGRNNPMARDEEGNRIAPARLSHRPG